MKGIIVVCTHLSLRFVVSEGALRTVQGHFFVVCVCQYYVLCVCVAILLAATFTLRLNPATLLKGCNLLYAPKKAQGSPRRQSYARCSSGSKPLQHGRAYSGANPHGQQSDACTYLGASPFNIRACAARCYPVHALSSEQTSWNTGGGGGGLAFHQN